MKNIYIIQNSNIGFDMDISKIYSPGKYSLFIIINEFSLKKLKERKQENYFNKIWNTNDFNFENIKNIICNNQYNNLPLQIVTNSEESISLCGELRTYFNTDEKNYARFTNKILMKKILNDSDLLTPKYILFDKKDYYKNTGLYLKHINCTLSYPLIAKPIDSMGCLGTQKITSTTELIAWCEQAVKTDFIYEIDEYIEGKVYNCDSYIKNKHIIFTQVSECSNSCYDFLCGLTKGTIALPHEDIIYKKLSIYAEQVHKAIGMPQNGVTHLEAILTKNGNIYFIEIAHRSPGILIPAMYKKFLNIDTIESHILLQIDENYNLNLHNGPYCAWIAFPTAEGKLKNQYVPFIRSEYELEWLKHPGDEMNVPKFGRHYAGKALLWNNDFQQLKDDFYYLNTFKFFDVEKNFREFPLKNFSSID